MSETRWPEDLQLKVIDLPGIRRLAIVGGSGVEDELKLDDAAQEISEVHGNLAVSNLNFDNCHPVEISCPNLHLSP